MLRVGFSEDIHKKEEGRKLVLAGIDFPGEIGLTGHSDADVVTHAVAESILGALALGDLGTHFPDNDPKYKGISSLILLDQVVLLMEQKGFRISNIDVQVACKSPKLADKILEMRKSLASHLKTELENVSVKACSYNGVGPIGNGEAIKASSYVALEK
jgi:2-C-methyl-D-erythritol 2,4-cyclodiphosphate synthase